MRRRPEGRVGGQAKSEGMTRQTLRPEPSDASESPCAPQRGNSVGANPQWFAPQLSPGYVSKTTFSHKVEKAVSHSPETLGWRLLATHPILLGPGCRSERLDQNENVRNGVAAT